LNDSKTWQAFPFCFLGGYADGSQRKAVQFSLMFTLGLTITFIIFRIIAGALGRPFGYFGGFWYCFLPPVAILLKLYLLFSDKLNLNIGL
jgi:cytochrome c-type biogenesis protein